MPGDSCSGSFAGSANGPKQETIAVCAYALGALLAEALRSDPELLERAAALCDRHSDVVPEYAAAAELLRRDLADYVAEWPR